MRSKIGRANQPYDSLGAFERDVKIMVENCISFNGASSSFAPSCVRFKFNFLITRIYI